jgi:protein-S-isoprenylcysteine O-methyltransferase Ste14
MEWLAWIDMPLFLGFAVAIARFAWAWDARHMIGMGVGVLGFALWLTARLQLGRSFSVRPEARALVTRGLYSKFRNPIYLFGGVAYGGLLVAWGRIAPLAVFLVFYSAWQFTRARRENAVLEKAFGEEYRRYKGQTWL